MEQRLVRESDYDRKRARAFSARGPDEVLQVKELLPRQMLANVEIEWLVISDVVIRMDPAEDLEDLAFEDIASLEIVPSRLGES